LLKYSTDRAGTDTALYGKHCAGLVVAVTLVHMNYAFFHQGDYIFFADVEAPHAAQGKRIIIKPGRCAVEGFPCRRLLPFSYNREQENANQDNQRKENISGAHAGQLQVQV
jgi:hypothetical protein